MYDWVLKYGKNLEYEMRSGYKYYSKEVAKRKGENFLRDVSGFYENAKIDIIEVIE